MQTDLQGLEIACKYFEQYRSEELLELRKTNRRLKNEITKLKITLAINTALLNAWLKWQRVQQLAV